MLYALTREDGGVTITTVMPKEVIITDGKMLPVIMVDGPNKKLVAHDGDKEIIFPLPSSDTRTYEADSVPGVVLTFYDIEVAIASNPDTIVSYEKITVDELPTTRAYRNAWARNGRTIEHNMVTARDIHRDKLRLLRKPKLAELDVAYQRADEAGDVVRKRMIAQDKQRLRDVTKDPRIEAAQNIEELASIGLPP
jgi:hypothetical protein